MYAYAGSLKCGVLSELGVVSVRFCVRFWLKPVSGIMYLWIVVNVLPICAHTLVTRGALVTRGTFMAHLVSNVVFPDGWYERNIFSVLLCSFRRTNRTNPSCRTITLAHLCFNKGRPNYVYRVIIRLLVIQL